MRSNDRSPDQLREVKISPEAIQHAEGSVEIKFGRTRLICTASVDESVPKWLAGSGQGWVSAEYGMLPRSTHTRIKRDKAANSGRSQEISRLIARSLRAAVDLKKLGEIQINVDCDVIEADGGTRTAGITGGFVALALALKFLKDHGKLKEWPLKNYIAAVSVGLLKDEALLDLDYEEDYACSTDMNFVMTDEGKFVEIQGTAEADAFSREQMSLMTDRAEKGCRDLFQFQQQLVGEFFPSKMS